MARYYSANDKTQPQAKNAEESNPMKPAAIHRNQGGSADNDGTS